MSLIIGRIEGNKLQIHSDSKLTDKDAAKDSPLCSVLKSLIIFPNLVISYAGWVGYAEIALENIFKIFRKNQSIGLDEILVTLHNANVESKDKTEFAIAQIYNKEEYYFYKISGGKISRNSDYFWLGDIDGYNLYQEVYHNKKKNGESTFSAMHSAFETVISSPQIPSVDHYHIYIQVDHKIDPGNSVFTYVMHSKIEIGSQVIKMDKKNKYFPIPLGNTANGSHGISYLSTLSPQKHGIAIHYIHGNFGIFFCPQVNLNQGIVISDVSGLEFAEKITKDYNIPVGGFIRHGETALKLIDTRSLLKDE